MRQPLLILYRHYAPVAYSLLSLVHSLLSKFEPYSYSTVAGAWECEQLSIGSVHPLLGKSVENDLCFLHTIPICNTFIPLHC